VDALFSGEPPPELLDGSTARRGVIRILWLAVPLDLLAIPLWTGVPGALLTLWAWLRADQAAKEVEAGRYSEEDATSLLKLKRLVGWAMAFILLSLLVQTWLLSKPAYTESYRGLWADSSP
jgi:hypothetical protein